MGICFFFFFFLIEDEDVSLCRIKDAAI
jgi:hypothetical protein